MSCVSNIQLADGFPIILVYSNRLSHYQGDYISISLNDKLSIAMYGTAKWITLTSEIGTAPYK